MIGGRCLPGTVDGARCDVNVYLDYTNEELKRELEAVQRCSGGTRRSGTRRQRDVRRRAVRRRRHRPGF